MDWLHVVLLVLLAVSAVPRSAHTPRWEPKFVTASYGSSLEIHLVRMSRTGLSPREINSLTVGEVYTDEPGWEKKLDDLVISARARMADLNAFIDSYTGTVS